MKERLLSFISYLGITPFAFENHAGLSRGTINSINNGIRSDKLALMLSAYPQLNPDYVLGLSDTMLRDSHDCEMPAEHIKELDARCDEYRKEIEELKGTCATLMRALDIITKNR